MTGISAGSPSGPEGDGISTVFQRVLADEPPFAVPLSPAVDAAIRHGRRRRIRIMAAQGVGAVCVVATLIAAVSVYSDGANTHRPPAGAPAPAAGAQMSAAI